MEEAKSVTCNICGDENVPHHKHDKKACISCATEYFNSIKPDLTRWTEGLSAIEKSTLIKEMIKQHFEKERLHKSEAEMAKASCRASYYEYKSSLLSAA